MPRVSVKLDERTTSPGHLSRLCRKRYGMSFQAYLPKTTQLLVSDVAKRVGYRDVSRFGQHFKRHHGQTPSEFRVQAQDGHS